MLVTKLLILLCATLTSGSDYYDLLGITKDADNKEIRKAFKKLAVTLHPDKNQDDSEAHDKFVKITRAYEVLKDPAQRKQYDLHGEETPSSAWGRGQYQSYTYYRDHFGIYDDDPQIVTLNAADFESMVSKSDKQWFVNYYSPLCSHCHDLAPVWRSLASELEGVVMFGAVNCEDDWNLCRQQNIRSYPSLMLYPANERFSGSRTEESLRRYILDKADSDIRFVTSSSEWAKLTEGVRFTSWVLLLCHSDELPECLYDDERVQLAATLNGLVGVAVIDCVSVPICPQLTQGEKTSIVYWQRSSDGESFATRAVLADLPRDMAKEVFTYLPELLQLDSVSFLDMVTQLEIGSQTPWLVQFYLGTDSELDLEIRKLPAMLTDMKVGRLHCARYSALCQDYSISRYPSFAVFKPGGGYEFHHGAVSALSVAQFTLESASATNLRTLSQQLYNQLVAQGDGQSAWFVDFYAPWCPPCLRLLPELRKASQSLHSVVRFGTVDCTIHAALCRQHNVQSYPTTVLFNQSQPSQQFRGEHSATSIVDFIQDVINPRVMKLTEETFYTTVGRKSPDSVWLVDFFMPWCGPCQQLAPQWRKLAKMVQDVPKVYIGEVNCEQEHELCRQQGVQSYPSIRLYPLQSNGLNTVAMYSGYQRDAKSIRQWLFNFLPSAVEDLTSASFPGVLEGEDFWLVDFYAPWCGHCHAFAPEFATVAKKLEGRVKCGKVNCESGYAVCQRAGVRAYPTVQFYRPNSRNAHGEEVTTQQAEKIVQFVEERLKQHSTVHDEL